jgi:hypothetical protein
MKMLQPFWSSRDLAVRFLKAALLVPLRTMVEEMFAKEDSYKHWPRLSACSYLTQGAKRPEGGGELHPLNHRRAACRADESGSGDGSTETGKDDA